MSFLNPPAVMPKLGVNLASLLALRDLRLASPALDVLHFAQAAQEAGADAIRLTIDSTVSEQKRADIDLVLRATSEVHLVMPLSRVMIDVALLVKPHSVCFAAPDGQRGSALSATSVRLMSEAVTALQRASIHVVLSLDLVPSQLQAVADTGITTIEFKANEMAQGGPVDPHHRRATLHAAVCDARQRGMAVHLAHGIDYGIVEQFAAVGDIAQINVGHAIAVRALTAGWQSAVREMKALLVTASARSASPSQLGMRG